MKTFIQTTFFNNVKPLFYALGILYLFLTVLHYFDLPEAYKYKMMALSFSSSVLLFITGIIYKKPPFSKKYITAVVAIFIVGLPAFNTLVHVYFMPDVKQTTNLIIVTLAAGLIILRTSWFVLTVGTLFIAWCLIMFKQIGEDDVLHFSIAYLMALLVSFVIHLNRVKTLKQLIFTQEKETEKNKELQIAKEELEHSITELKKAKLQAEDAAEVKERFLSNMSHEMRTPLNTVISLAELLIEKDPREDQIDEIETLKFAAENLLSLISEILDFTKINAGALTIYPKPFNFHKQIKNLLASHNIHAKKKNIKLKLEIDDNLPEVLIGDRIRLIQVLNNLLSNAVKFTPNGYVLLKINQKIIDNNIAELTFIIQDSGIGMTIEQQHKIFAPFIQGENDTSQKYGGTGLGLTISHQLVELMHGELEMESKLEEGSTFTFSLKFPIGKDIENELLSDKQDKRDSLKGMRVLIADDNRVSLLVLKKILNLWGVVADSAENGEVAVEKVQVNNYDLVLMDIHMSVMDGYQATKIIRNLDDANVADIPIIAFTASAQQKELDKINSMGMNGHIFKPFNQNELFEILKSFSKVSVEVKS